MKKVAIHVSKRAKIRLSESEMDELRDYTENPQNAPFATIHASAGIAPKTTKSILENGFAERDTAIRMRDFLKALKQLQNEASN